MHSPTPCNTPPRSESASHHNVEGMEACSGSPEIQSPNSTRSIRPKIRNIRGYDKTSWSKDEKKLIYFCYHIAKNMQWEWGGLKVLWMRELINRANNPTFRGKIEGTTIKNYDHSHLLWGNI